MAKELKAERAVLKRMAKEENKFSKELKNRERNFKKSENRLNNKE